MGTLTDMISQGLDSGVEKSWRSLTEKIVFITPVQDWPDFDVFNKICAAIKSGERMTMRYRNAMGEESRRHIEPLRLVNYSGRWYLVSFDLQRKMLRTFHLSRILDLQQISGDRIHSRFSDEQLDTFIHAGYGIFMGDQVQMVTFRVYGWAINTLATQSWHPNQKRRMVNEGEVEALEVTLPVSNLQEILSALLFFGPNARPLAPSELVTLYRDSVKRMQEQIE